MRIGYTTGYWKSGPPSGVLEAIQRAEKLGFESVWTAETYGSDAFTPLAWWGSRTERVALGTAVAQLSARSPAATAMSAMTLDHLSGGRFILGLGVSGPQVVEGWHGAPFEKPLARTREYISIVRDIIRREGPVTAPGPHYPLPYLGPKATGLGKPLRSTIHPLRPRLPIYLAAQGPRNVELAAEMADGWLPGLFSPRANGDYASQLAAGFAKRDSQISTPATFEVAVQVPVVLDRDVEAAADRVRPTLALYVGGMGSHDVNLHRDAIARLGYEDACNQIQELYLGGKKREAVAAVPTSMVEDIALIGPPDKVRDDLQMWEESVATTILVRCPMAMMEEVHNVVVGG